MARHRGRRPAVVLALALTSAGLSGPVLAAPAGAGGTTVTDGTDGTDGVTICHAAGNSGRWVVLTVDASALTSRGHRAHQAQRDVIPPFEHTAQDGSRTTVAGQHWADSWPVDAAGRATGAVDAADCGPAPARTAREHEGRAKEKQRGTSAERGSTATPGGEDDASARPSGAAETPEPAPAPGSGEQGGDTRPALVGGGLALLLAGGATAVGVTRRRGGSA